LQVRGPDAAPYRIEISNGNGVTGMARSVGDQLKRAGFNVVRLTNQLPFRQPITEIQYRDGRISDAGLLSAAMEQTPIVPSKALRSDIHVRVVLGRNTLEPTALLNPDFRNEPLPMLAAGPVPERPLPKS
jgi:hypothetical protein